MEARAKERPLRNDDISQFPGLHYTCVFLSLTTQTFWRQKRGERGEKSGDCQRERDFRGEGDFAAQSLREDALY